MTATLRTVAWALMTYTALAVGWGAWTYVMGDPWHYDPIFRAKYTAHLTLVRLHGAGGVIALLIGPFQFWGDLRALWPRLHRVLGYLYVTGVVLAAVTGFEMGTMAHGGLFARTTFCAMAALWLYTALRAVQTAVAGRVEAHRRWMLRNFVLTFGAVLIRVYLALLMQLDFDFERVYPMTAWCAWVPNLLVLELVLAKPGYARLRRLVSARQTAP